jgi:hypothetical protein
MNPKHEEFKNNIVPLHNDSISDFVGYSMEGFNSIKHKNYYKLYIQFNNNN